MRKLSILFALLITMSFTSAILIDSGNGQFVFSERVSTTLLANPGTGGATNTFVGTIDDLGASSIHIVRIGIGGDSAQASGDNRFRVQGGGLDFTFTAGQSATAADFDLGFTPQLNGQAHGFVYQEVDLVANAGEDLTVSWNFHNDNDGFFTQDTDVLGNFFNDSDASSSSRVWIQFEVLGGAVPEPSSMISLALGICSMLFVSRLRK